MKKVLEVWNKLEDWQKLLAGTVFAWAVAWVSFGALSALTFGLGAAFGFFTGAVRREDA